MSDKTMLKREEFAISLRKEKKKMILDRRRQILGSKGKSIEKDPFTQIAY